MVMRWRIMLAIDEDDDDDNDDDDDDDGLDCNGLMCCMCNYGMCNRVFKMLKR
jgi:hypothetical protein